MANRVHLLGHTGSAPEIKATTNSKVAKFSLATSETYKGVKTTQWHHIVAWGKLAEICEKYVTKGQQLYIEGKISYREWEKDGKKHYATEIVASLVEFVGSKADKPAEQDYGDIPF